MEETIQKSLQENYREELLKIYDEYISKHNMEPIYLFGIESDFGWDCILNLVFRTIKKLFKPEEIQVTQIKEKFGTLRFYYDFTDYSKIDDKLYNELNACIRNAEVSSSITCEHCGEAGKIRKGSWLIVLCDSCDKERRKE